MQVHAENTTELTIVAEARQLAGLADTLHAECIEMTLPSSAMAAMAREVGRRANTILDRLTCCQPSPLPSLKDAAYSEQMDELLGEGRR